MEQKETVIVLFNGGMHSAIAAFLLKQQGFKVIGLGINFSKQVHKIDNTNAFPINLDQCAALAKKIDIGFYAVQADALYEHFVLDPMVSARMVGYSFDPFIAGTKLLYDLLLEKTQKLKANLVSSGHRARVRFNKLTNEFYVEQHKDAQFDQSRLLCALSQHHLQSLQLPLSDIAAEKLAQIAKVAGIEFEESESPDPYFMNSANLLPLYLKRIPPSMRAEGDIVDRNIDATIGSHLGLCYFHLGMDKIVDKNNLKLDRLLKVKNFDHAKSIVYVDNKKEPSEYNSCGVIKYHSYLSGDESKPLRGFASLQGETKLSEGMIYFKNNNCIYFEFSEPLKKELANGMSIVFYEKHGDGILLLGGGEIYIVEDNKVVIEIDPLLANLDPEKIKPKAKPTLSF